MGKSDRPWVFLCHKFETADGKRHDVTVQPKKGKYTTKKFTKLPDAKKYAAKESRKLKLRTYLAELPKGSRDINVSKKPKKKSPKRRTKDPFSLF